jgi:photosystem II stability/assembly factor-like uncharacterized protein
MGTGVKAGMAALALLLAAAVSHSASVLLSDLKEQTHIHGLAVNPANPDQILVATHHGLYRAGLDGQAELISPVQDFMGFTRDPGSRDTLFASGHPAGGGNLGFIASSDGGRSWKQIAPGANGPVDFHQMSVSAADPKVIFGAYGGLQVSRDAGKTWSVVGPLPEKLIDLAASAKDAETIYAATEDGLSLSRTGGKTWERVLEGAPVSLVEVSPDGLLYAFVLGRGLVMAPEADLTFRTIAGQWGDRILLHLAVDPADRNRLFAATHKGDILASTDGGARWAELGR